MERIKSAAIILAAGKGSRMETDIPKQFIVIHNKPVLYYALKAFEESNIDEIILVTSEETKKYCSDNIVKKYGLKKVSCIVEGGSERFHSVLNGLKAIDQSDYVLIHDGARPLIDIEMINEVIEYVQNSGGCIVATPVKETIKKIDNNHYIEETPKRSSLWAAQTPQAFRYDELLEAYINMSKDKEFGSMEITDDASVYEKYIRKPVKIIEGSYGNIKITTPEDLIFAEKVIELLKKI